MRFAIRTLMTAAVLRRRTAVPVAAVHFACPKCQQDLLPVDKNALRCSNNHWVNVAKEGHINLLPPARKNAAAEAESDAAARAQRALFEGGGFEAQIDAITKEVARALGSCPPDPEGDVAILNVGCGEGLYLRRLAVRLDAEKRDTPMQLFGTDTNKLGVRYASKRQRDAGFAVCAPTRLPFADGTFSVVFAVFSPSPWEEFCRVLKPGGVVIVARAGNKHLQELHKVASSMSGAPSADAVDPPKKFSAGLAENYIRICTEEAYTAQTLEQIIAITPWGKQPTDAQGHREELLERRLKLPPVTNKGSGDEAPDRHQEPSGSASVQGTTTTVDFIISTHRVWLGTGGEPV